MITSIRGPCKFRVRPVGQEDPKAPQKQKLKPSENFDVPNYY